MAEKIYTVPEAAEYLRVTRAAIYKWIQQEADRRDLCRFGAADHTIGD